jgi:hypothetical protein
VLTKEGADDFGAELEHYPADDSNNREHFQHLL